MQIITAADGNLIFAFCYYNIYGGGSLHAEVLFASFTFKQLCKFSHASKMYVYFTTPPSVALHTLIDRNEILETNKAPKKTLW